MEEILHSIGVRICFDFPALEITNALGRGRHFTSWLVGDSMGILNLCQ
jgi:hypothetical protein